MKNKIYVHLLLISITAIFVTILAGSAYFYDLYEKQVLQEIKTAAHLLESLSLEGLDEHDLKELEEKKIRITRIDEKGTVIYDSSVQPQIMENHRGRREVQQALSNGEGEDSRRSKTLGRITYYYAVAEREGGVIRVSKEAAGLLSILYEMAPIIFIIGIGCFLLCLMIAKVLTVKIMEPIEEMVENMVVNEDGTTKPSVYYELNPVMKKIYQQHTDILKNAKIRQEFTANVSHELKTPLTAISGYAQLIENGMAGAEESRYFAGEIEKNSKRLLNLINDIIRLSELDSGNLCITEEKVNLKEVALQCIQVLKMYASQNNVSIEFRGQDAYVWAERAMLEELIYNLCDNAIRYNRENGSVEVVVSYYFKKVVLTIEDTGIGIEEEYQERIFERFYRVDKSRSKKTGGTGLGLAIVKHIVSCMRAQLKLKSEVGVGTKIEIIFPEIEDDKE
ncbi:MAG: two-component sensor histidine kinase [Lachnospiraceae bacterium]|nr:two-component sensor histidine kinase [Lachnospiraceae bacterium]